MVVMMMMIMMLMVNTRRWCGRAGSRGLPGEPWLPSFPPGAYTATIQIKLLCHRHLMVKIITSIIVIMNTVNIIIIITGSSTWNAGELLASFSFPRC